MAGVKRSAPASNQKNKKPKTKSRDLDQFHTIQQVAEQAVRHLVSFYPQLESHGADRMWIEPSVGKGAFYIAARKLCAPRHFVLIDLDPQCIEDTADVREPFVVENLTQDFLSYKASQGGCICVGNPPFGQNASMALAFINHAAKFCDVVAFILPNSFHKISIMNRVDRNMHVVHVQNVPENAFLHDGEVVHVPSSFFVFAHSRSAWIEPSLRGAQRALLEAYPINSKYITFQREWSEETTFMIQRVGNAAGRVTREHHLMRGKETSINFYFVIVHFEHIADHAASQRVRTSFNMENVEEKYWTAGMASITKSDVVKYLVKEIEERHD